MLTDGRYPFNIEFIVANNGEMAANGGECSITICANWKFELDDPTVTQEQINAKDALDTEYGELAYEFHQEHPYNPDDPNNPGEPSIKLEVDLIATQII